MKLYFSPGACSLAPHIALRETNTPFTLEKVDTATHKTAQGDDYYALNAKGAVPMLELASGERLTEGPVIAQYVAELARDTKLLPPAGSLARYRVLEWQNYITSELHKSFSPLFGKPALDAAGKAAFVAALGTKLSWVSSQLRDKDYLTGADFTVADAYLFAVASWARFVELDLSGAPELSSFLSRVRERPAVQAAMRAEGLIA